MKYSQPQTNCFKKGDQIMNKLFTSTNAVLMSLSLTVAPWATALAANTDDMVFIPKGEFNMGSKDHSDEVPHKVVVDGYHIDKYEVSNAQYKEFMRATMHPAPAYWDDPRLNKPDQPVVGVNWYDSNAFCEWKGKRLPTEAEWERAAKGPDESHYPWGHKIDPTRANYGQNVGKTQPVDSYPNGVSGYGLYNMAGNVFEWVSDWYTNFPAHQPSILESTREQFLRGRTGFPMCEIGGWRQHGNGPLPLHAFAHQHGKREMERCINGNRQSIGE
jgi:formylglycine-generating enzyme required for sulfatase activity